MTVAKTQLVRNNLKWVLKDVASFLLHCPLAVLHAQQSVIRFIIYYLVRLIIHCFYIL